MKVLRLLVTLFAVGIFLGGCAYVMSPVLGALYTDVKAPVDAEGSMDAPRTGEACAVSILGLIATGDASIDAAKKAGGIKEVLVVDYSSTNILGLYAKFCTIVKGR